MWIITHELNSIFILSDLMGNRQVDPTMTSMKTNWADLLREKCICFVRLYGSEYRTDRKNGSDPRGRCRSSEGEGLQPFCGG